MNYLTMALIGFCIIWTVISFFLSKDKKLQKKVCESPKKGIFLDEDDETTIEDMKKVANEIFSGVKLAREAKQYSVHMVLNEGKIIKVNVQTARSIIEVTQKGCTYINRAPSVKERRVKTFLMLMMVGTTICIIITCTFAMINLGIHINSAK